MPISTGFNNSSYRRPLIWYSQPNVGDITTQSIAIPLYTSKQCTYELISVTPSSITPYILNNTLIVDNNPHNNITYSVGVRASSGAFNENITFTFVAKNSAPIWTDKTNILIPNEDEVRVSVEATDTDSKNLIYNIIRGTLPEGITFSNGVFSGKNPYSNSSHELVISVTDGYNFVSKTLNLIVPPPSFVYSLPYESTQKTNEYNRGPWVIDTDWLISQGWNQSYANIIVNTNGDRAYSNDGFSDEGNGISDQPTLSIKNIKNCNLTVVLHGSIFGSWGRGGLTYNAVDVNGVSGGIGIQIDSPCTLDMNGHSVHGGNGGGGAAGGYGGSGGIGIAVTCAGVKIANNGGIISGGCGGGGGIKIKLDSSVGSGTNGSAVTCLGGFGYQGGVGGTLNNLSGINNVVDHPCCAEGVGGSAIISYYPYTLSPVGTIYGYHS